MWGAVSSLAGKGVGLAGAGINKARSAASYVGDVVAPVLNDAMKEDDGYPDDVVRSGDLDLPYQPSRREHNVWEGTTPAVDETTHLQQLGTPRQEPTLGYAQAAGGYEDAEGVWHDGSPARPPRQELASAPAAPSTPTGISWAEAQELRAEVANLRAEKRQMQEELAGMEAHFQNTRRQLTGLLTDRDREVRELQGSCAQLEEHLAEQQRVLEQQRAQSEASLQDLREQLQQAAAQPSAGAAVAEAELEALKSRVHTIMTEGSAHEEVCVAEIQRLQSLLEQERRDHSEELSRLAAQLEERPARTPSRPGMGEEHPDRQRPRSSTTSSWGHRRPRGLSWVERPDPDNHEAWVERVRELEERVKWINEERAEAVQIIAMSQGKALGSPVGNHAPQAPPPPPPQPDGDPLAQPNGTEGLLRRALEEARSQLSQQTAAHAEALAELLRQEQAQAVIAAQDRARLEGELAGLGQEAQRLQEELASALERLRGQEGAAAAATAEAEDREGRLQEALELLEGREAARRAAEAEAAHWKERLEDASGQMQLLDDTATAEREQLVELKSQLHSALEQLRTVDDSAREAGAQITHLQAELDAARARAADAEARAQRSAQQEAVANQHSAAQVAQLRQQLALAAERAEQLEARSAEQMGRLGKEVGSHDGQPGDEDSLEEELRELQRRLADAEDEKFALVRKCAVAEGEARGISERVQQLEMEVAGSREACRAAEQDATALRESNRSLMSQAEQLRATFDELPEVYDIIREMRGGSDSPQNGGGLGLVDLVRGAAAALKQQVEARPRWEAALATLLKQSTPASNGRQGNASAGMDELLREVQRAWGDLLAAQHKAQQLEQAQNGAAQEREELLQRIASLQAEADKHRRQWEGQREEGSELRRRWQEACAKEQALQGELSQKEHMVTQLNTVIAQMRDMARSQSGDAGRIKQERDALALQAEAQAREVRRLQMDVGELEAHLETLQGSGNERERLGGQISQLQGELGEAREALRQREAELLAQHREHQSALQRAHELGGQVAAASADLQLALSDRDRAETALRNLQGVVEQMQAERETEASVVEDRHRRALDSQQKAFDAREASIKAVWEGKVEDARRDVSRALEAEKRARAAKEGEVLRVRDELKAARKALDEAMARVQSGQDDNLDRQLVANLVVRYISSRHSRDVLDLMARILQLTDEQKMQVGLLGRRGSGQIVSGLLHAVIGPAGEEQDPPPAPIQGDTLSEMWLNFLMAETGDQTDSGK